ncbi:MAG TPA: hypothetical protein VNA21_01935, partial [Steroidobacteraceae bacterium]|nr:hypothetical protein [Steroidobacteraceae bacterium]
PGYRECVSHRYERSQIVSLDFLQSKKNRQVSGGFLGWAFERFFDSGRIQSFRQWLRMKVKPESIGTRENHGCLRNTVTSAAATATIIFAGRSACFH